MSLFTPYTIPLKLDGVGPTQPSHFSPTLERTTLDWVPTTGARTVKTAKAARAPPTAFHDSCGTNEGFGVASGRNASRWDEDDVKEGDAWEKDFENDDEWMALLSTELTRQLTPTPSLPESVTIKSYSTPLPIIAPIFEPAVPGPERPKLEEIS